MGDVIFARPRWDYDSYKDFYRLIELSNYELLFFDEIDPFSENTYIMTILNGENQNGWYNPTARIILWDLEWRLEGEYRLPPGVCEAWGADYWYADKVNIRYVPFGSHPDLALEPVLRGEYAYDVAWLAYNSHRRSTIYNNLIEQGLTIAPNGHGEERHRILSHSRCMVYSHQLDHVNVIAPQRFALAAAYSLPLITETLYHRGIFHTDDFLPCDFDHLARFTRIAIDTYALEDYGLSLHNRLCRDYSFRRCVEGAV